MKFDNNKPIYLQIVSDIKNDIVQGKRIPGEKLPSTRELALLYSVNPNTAQRVYKELESQGLSFTLRGKGTYLSKANDLVSKIKIQMANNLIDYFIDGMKNLGFDCDDMINIIENKKLEKGDI